MAILISEAEQAFLDLFELSREQYTRVMERAGGTLPFPLEEPCLSTEMRDSWDKPALRNGAASMSPRPARLPSRFRRSERDTGGEWRVIHGKCGLEFVEELIG